MRVNGKVVKAQTLEPQSLFVGQVQNANKVKGPRDIHLRLLLFQTIDSLLKRHKCGCKGVLILIVSIVGIVGIDIFIFQKWWFECFSQK